MSRRQAAAIGALLLCTAGLALALSIAVAEFPRRLVALACVAVASAGTWYGLLHLGPVRVLGFAVGAAGVASALLLIVSDRAVGSRARPTLCVRAGRDAQPLRARPRRRP